MTTLQANAIFEHGKADKEIQFFDTGMLLTRREVFLQRIKDAAELGFEPADNTYYLARSIFRAMRTAERLALEEEAALEGNAYWNERVNRWESPNY